VKRNLHRGLSVLQLRLFLGLLFLALALPTVVLIAQTRRQIQWETFHQYQTLAEEVAARIDAELQRLVAAEEARSTADYRFAVVAGAPAVSNLVQRSPLAGFPVVSEFPGVIGYFEIDADGEFSSPLLPPLLDDPAQWGMDAAEFAQRQALRENLREILSRNQLVERRRDRDALAQSAATVAEGAVADAVSPAKDEAAVLSELASASGQAAFDKLNAPASTVTRAKRNDLGRVEDLPIAQNYEREAAQTQAASASQRKVGLDYQQQLRAPRKEQNALPEQLPEANVVDRRTPATRVRIFESEVDPFEFSLLDSGHGVLFRKVWTDGRRTIQGAIVSQPALLEQAVAAPFSATALAQMSDLVIAWDGDVLKAVRNAAADPAEPQALAGELLYQTRLSAPLGGFQLLWTIDTLPAGAGARVVGWSGVVLFAVLTLGFLALYRLGLRQITLARLQQDFVSAVSHELKTPLTSIRMYAEMLREGWAGEDRKRGYYEFIHDESERLSRLIANVLQLARLERNELHLELKPVAVAALMDMLRSRVHAQIERAGFECSYTIDPACVARELDVDVDAFIQIVINLVDNALKFSAGSARRALEISVRARDASTVAWSVRDHGPGVPKAQAKKIFELFYRSGSELTRETTGTGIGLALVRQLARAMHGEVEVVQRDPGAEFVLVLPGSAAGDRTRAETT
jgi:signal transduction histidine kinase